MAPRSSFIAVSMRSNRVPASPDRIAPLIRHHIVVAAPKRLLILGDAPARVLLGKPLAQARSETHVLAIAGTDIPTIASFHPRFVLERPDFRKPAWADLQMFMAL